MKKLLALSLIATLGLWLGTASTAQDGDAAAAPKLESMEQKASYSIGFSIGTNIKNSGGEVDVDLVAQGMKAALAGKESALDAKASAEAMRAFQTAARKRADEQRKKASADNIAKGKAFLEANAKKEGVKTTASGLQYKVLKAGSGPKPTTSNKVKVHYHGTLIDGTVFDSSVDRGEPIEFPVTGVIKGWVEGLQLMSVGAKFQLVIPSELAYGANPRPGGKIGPNAVLVFEVELLEIK